MLAQPPVGLVFGHYHGKGLSKQVFGVVAVDVAVGLVDGLEGAAGAGDADTNRCLLDDLAYALLAALHLGAGFFGGPLGALALGDVEYEGDFAGLAIAASDAHRVGEHDQVVPKFVPHGKLTARLGAARQELLVGLLPEVGVLRGHNLGEGLAQELVGRVAVDAAVGLVHDLEGAAGVGDADTDGRRFEDAHQALFRAAKLLLAAPPFGDVDDERDFAGLAIGAHRTGRVGEYRKGPTVPVLHLKLAPGVLFALDEVVVGLAPQTLLVLGHYHRKVLALQLVHLEAIDLAVGLVHLLENAVLVGHANADGRRVDHL